MELTSSYVVFGIAVAFWVPALAYVWITSPPPKSPKQPSTKS
jgi:hypothetical protein